MTLTTIVEIVLALAPGHPTRVAVDGRSGAGKTTFGDELAAALLPSGRQVIRASADAFARPAAERYARGQLSSEGYYLDGVNLPEFRARLLDPLGPDGQRSYVTAIFDTAAASAIEMTPQRAEPDAILVVDGVFALRPELADCWDYRVFLQADPDVSYGRAMRRDSALPSWSDLVQRYEKRYKPAEDLYIESVHPEQLADVVVSNTDPWRRSFRFRNVR